MKCKDIPELPILEFLFDLNGENATWFEYGISIRQVFPNETPAKLVLAKMKNLIKRGWVSGCGCGCRGDFKLTYEGAIALGKLRLLQ